mgnify:CR=1 FL=1
MKVEQWGAYIVAFLLAINFFLLFLPLLNDSSSNWILIVTYGTAIVAVYESVIHKQSKFISLIIVTLMMAGLMLEIKNLFLELRAPKLKPIKPDKGIQGVSILN